MYDDEIASLVAAIQDAICAWVTSEVREVILRPETRKYPFPPAVTVVTAAGAAELDLNGIPNRELHHEVDAVWGEVNFQLITHLASVAGVKLPGIPTREWFDTVDALWEGGTLDLAGHDTRVSQLLEDICLALKNSAGSSQWLPPQTTCRWVGEPRLGNA